MFGWFRPTKAKAAAALMKAFRTGKFDPAIRLYEKLLRDAPNDHELHNDLGVAFLESGNLAAALAQLHKATELYDCCIHRNNLGRALLRSKDFASAVIAFGKARELDPNDPQPWYNLTICLREEGREQESLAQLVEFVRRFPDHANGLNDLGLHCEEQGNKEEALQKFQQSVTLAPASIPARVNMIRMLCDLGRYPDATPHLETLAQLGMKVHVNATETQVVIHLNDMRVYEGTLKAAERGNDN